MAGVEPLVLSLQRHSTAL